MRTVWLNRRNLPLGAPMRPDAVITTLTDLPRILGAMCP